METTPARFRALLDLAADHLERFLTTLPDQPMVRTAGGRKLARSLREPMPEGPVAAEALMRLLFERVLPRSFNTASAGYMAYIPGGGLPESGVADLIADVCNRYVGLWIAAPGAVQLEVNVIRWLCGLAGYGEAAGGVLTSGGSMANLSGLLCARERLGERFQDGVIYCSSQVHHSVRKAAKVIGFLEECIQVIEVDERYRMKVDVVRARMAEDRAAGRRPCAVVASAGTTATGAVDPLEALAGLCAEAGIWLHVDAAYGGSFLFTERGRSSLAGIGRADSITLDPHKGMFLPYGTGALLVRDRAALTGAHRMGASYLPASQTEEDLWDFADMSPELSRDFRGLRLWLPWKLHGSQGFRAMLDEKLDLAAWAADQVRGLPGVRLVAAPELSLFAFRWEPRRASGAGDRARVDRENRLLLQRVNAGQRVFLTGVEVPDPEAGGAPIFVIRVCVLSFRTHRARVEEAVEAIRTAIREAGTEAGPEAETEAGG